MKRFAFTSSRIFTLTVLTVACLTFAALLLKDALPGGISFARSPKTSALFMSKPAVNVHVAGAEIPKMALLNDEFCYTARITNTGGTDPGFAPYIRLITPVGVSLTSATLLNVSNTGTGNELSTFTFTPTTPTAVGTLPIQDPLLPSGNFVAGNSQQQLWIIQPPIGSVVSGQSAIDIRICLRVIDQTLVNQQLQIKHQPVYLYGTGTLAKDNQSFVLGDEISDPFTPVVVKFRKVVLNAPVNDTAGQAPYEFLTGECNPVTFQLIADIATGVPLTNLVFNDLFPMVNGAVGLELTKNLSKQVKIITPGGSKMVTANLTGNVLSVSEQSASGVLVSNVPSDKDVIVEFQANVPKAFFNNSSNTANCPLQNLTNTATFDAQYNGLSILQLNSSLSFTVKVASLQKTASPAVAAPGDTINFALKIIVSESDSLEVIFIDDVLPDGLTYVSSSAKLMINGNNVSNLLTVGYDGKTLKIKIQNGTSITPIFGACVLNELTYQAVVDQNYPNGGAPVLAGDKLMNEASMGYGRFNNDHKQCYAVNGYTEKASSQVVIRPANEVTKSILNNPLSGQFLPGDEVKFSLKMCIPSGDAKSIMFTDYLPPEFFDLSTVSQIGTLIQTPSGTATSAGPLTLQDGSVMFTINPDPFITNPTTPTCFEIQFKVKVANKTFPSAMTITNYLLAKTVKSDNTPDSHITGVTLNIGQPNPVLTIAKSICSVSTGSAGTVNTSGNVDNADAGDKLNYCITITNTSQATAHNVIVLDKVPVGLTYVNGSLAATGATPNESQKPTLRADAAQLQPGQTITVTYMATVDANTAPCRSKITNTANVQWSATSTSNSSTIVPDSADVNFARPTITKTVKGGSKTATIGETITYEIKVCMPEGAFPPTGTTTPISISDALPTNLIFDSATLIKPTTMSMTPSSISGSGPWNFTSVTVPGNNDLTDNCFTIEIKAKVGPSNQQGTFITNTASLTVPGCTGPLSSTVNTIVVEPSLTVKKEFVPTTAKPGDSVQVKLTIMNSGQAPAYDVKIDDTLPLALINPTGTAQQSGFTLNTSGQVVSFSGGTVPANSSVVLTFTVTAHVPCGEVNNIATISTASTLPGDVPGERKYSDISGVAKLTITCVCAPVSQVSPSGAMTGWWTFDEASGPLAADLAGFPNNGTHKNGVTPTTISNGLVNRALEFSGNGYVEVPVHGALNFANSAFSIDAWVRTTQASGKTPIVDRRVGSNLSPTTGTGYRMYLDNGRLAFQVGITTYVAPTSSQNVADGNWHFVAVVRSSTNVVLYVDGKAVLPAAPPPSSTSLINNSANLYIGRSHPYGTNLPYFIGRLDEVEIFKGYALTAANVKSIYEAGSAGKCKPACTLVCQPGTLPAATAGVLYSAPIIAGGTPTNYSATNLPPGLSLVNGNLTGTPMKSGSYSFTITMTDQNGCSVTCTYSLTVGCQNPTITTTSPLPKGTLGSGYNQTLVASGGGAACGAYQFTQVGGLLPTGITLSANGTLLGLAKACDTYDFTVKVTDKCGCMATKSFSLTIEGAPMPIGDAFNTGVNDNKTPRSPGQNELHYTLTGANGAVIPADIIIKQPSWVNPSNSGTVSAWIGPHSPPANVGEMIYSLPLNLTNCDNTVLQIEGQYASSGTGYITVNNGTTKYAATGTNSAQSFTSFSLPTSEFTNGINTIKFHVQLVPGQSGLLVEFTKTNKKCCPCQLAVGPNVLPEGKKGTAYTGQFTATGGVPPYTFTVTATPFPAGLAFGADGKITGTPVGCGEYTLIVKAVDSQGCMGIREYKLKINCSQVVVGDVETGDGGGGSGFAEQQQPTTSFLTARINAQILGNEKTIRFSLGFDPAVLSNPFVTLGSGAQNATLELDPSQLDQGNLGISITQPDGILFAEGRQEVAVVTWEFISSDRGRATRIEFKDTPVARSIINQSGAALETQFNSTPVVLATKAAIVSAASYAGERLAPNQMVAAFGVGLATATQVATTLPLPTTLAGTTIKVRDSANVERLAPLFFVAPTQINYLIPAGTAAGAATVIITSGNGTVSGAVVEIANVAPGIFVADASGRGLPAANALLFRADGSSSSSVVARFDPASSRFVAVPIDLGAIGDRVFLSLFGTGIRNRSSLSNVRAIVGGFEAPLQFAGDQGGFAGLDQINIELPRSLAGSGLVDVLVIVDGQLTNIVQVSIL